MHEIEYFKFINNENHLRWHNTNEIMLKRRCIEFIQRLKSYCS